MSFDFEVNGFFFFLVNGFCGGSVVDACWISGGGSICSG